MLMSARLAWGRFCWFLLSLSLLLGVAAAAPAFAATNKSTETNSSKSAIRPAAKPVSKVVKPRKPLVVAKRPIAKPVVTNLAPVSSKTLVDNANLSGSVGFVLFDVKSGEILESHEADRLFIPASVTKLPTAVYALSVLGPTHQFTTRLMAKQAPEAGVLNGDLWLVGGGDPTLDSGDLSVLLSRAGLTQVSGKFHYDANWLPLLKAIDPSQPVHAPYNPGVCGLNLNFNRVLMKWESNAQSDADLGMWAHAAATSVPTQIIRARFSSEVGHNEFKHALTDGGEAWSVSPHRFQRRGARWLPVRAPDSYAAHALRDLAGLQGLNLELPTAASAPAKGVEIARFDSPTLEVIVRGMLRHSTNLTAEVIGSAATRAKQGKPVDVAQSGKAMTDWLRAMGDEDTMAGLYLVNHSGLSTKSRISPNQMRVFLLKAAKSPPPGVDIFALLSDETPTSARSEPKIPDAVVRAKTGTIYYGRSLAGYIRTESGRMLGFAYFATDLNARADLDAEMDPESDMVPRQARVWLNKARYLERALLRNWIVKFN